MIRRLHGSLADADLRHDFVIVTTGICVNVLLSLWLAGASASPVPMAMDSIRGKII